MQPSIGHYALSFIPSFTFVSFMPASLYRIQCVQRMGKNVPMQRSYPPTLILNMDLYLCSYLALSFSCAYAFMLHASFSYAYALAVGPSFVLCLQLLSLPLSLSSSLYTLSYHQGISLIFHASISLYLFISHFSLYFALSLPFPSLSPLFFCTGVGSW